MRFYVYELIDPRDGATFYVGKGQRKRIDAHEVEARNGKRSRKCERIRDIEASGLSVRKMKVAHFEDEKEAYLAEAQLVDHYGLENLTNSIPGGSGAYSAALEELRRRKGHTVTSDHSLLKNAVELIRRTMNIRANGHETFTLCGVVISLAEIEASLIRVVDGITARWGLEWVQDRA